MRSMGGVGRREGMCDDISKCRRGFNDREASLQRSASEIEYSIMLARD